MALKLNERYPGRFDNPSGGYPYGSFKNRTTPSAKDGSYLEKDWANDWLAFFQSLLVEAGLVANGSVDAVGSSQFYDALVAVIQDTSTDYLNTTRVDVASAGTVNLTSSAPDTRHINITGATTIAAFTVAAGQCYFVRFAAALTLTNGASIVTNTGANIITAAGDTCIIRATADNVVEVLCYARSQSRSIGDGQTWQDVSGSRTAGTAYQNTTGRSIEVSLELSNVNGRDLEVSTDGVAWTKVAWSTGGGFFTVSAVIPNLYYYRVLTAYSAGRWMELR